MTDVGETYDSIWQNLRTVSFRQGFVQADGLRTRFVEAGDPDRPTVLLLHGTGGHWETFCRNIGPFAQDHHVLALDFLGCGFSEKPDRPYEIAGYVAQVHDFLAQLGIDRPVGVVGVSLGSWVACRLALSHPDDVAALVLCSATGLYGLQASQADTVRRRSAAAADASWEHVSAVLRKLYYSPDSLMDDMVGVRQAVYRSPTTSAVAARMLTLFDADVRERNLLSEDEWRSITQPALVVRHVDSPDVYLETARAISDLMPNAQGLDLPKTAHWPHFEQAAAFNAEALSFLAAHLGG